MPSGVPKTAPKHEPAGVRQRSMGILIFAERNGGDVRTGTVPTGTRRVKLCSRRSLDWEFAACEVQVFCHGVGEGRADGGRRIKEHCGAS